MTVFYGIIQWILSVAEILLCYYFCDVMVDKGLVKRNWIYVGSWSVVIGTLLDINRYIVFMSYSMIIVQCILGYISLPKKCRSIKNCFGVILTYNACLALLQLFNAFILLVVVRVVEVDDIYSELNLYRMFCYLIALLVVCGMTVGLSKFKKNSAVSLESSRWLLLVYGGIGLFVIMAFQTQLLTYGKSESMKNVFLLFSLIIITLLIFFLHIRYLVTKAGYQVLEMKSRMMEEHYQEIYQMYQNCACSIHDFKTHLVSLEEYCKAEQYQKALAYMEKIGEPLSIMEHYIKSGNEIVDLILNFKLSEAKEKDITVETDIESMYGISIEDNDLCAIFTNLFDNAIEACAAMNQEEKWIKILVKNSGDMLIVKIVNSYSNELQEIHGEYLTSKKEGLHGYGMKSVRLKVEKYEGSVEWSHTDEAFTTVVTFFNVVPIQKEEEENGYGKKSGESQSGGRFMARDARSTGV